MKQEVNSLTKVEKPHLNLLEMMQSRIDGFEPMKRIARITNASAGFLRSFRDGNQKIARAFEKGADDYIMKSLFLHRIGGGESRRPCTGGGVTWSVPREPYVLRDLTINYGNV